MGDPIGLHHPSVAVPSSRTSRTSRPPSPRLQHQHQFRFQLNTPPGSLPPSHDIPQDPLARAILARIDHSASAHSIPPPPPVSAHPTPKSHGAINGRPAGMHIRSTAESGLAPTAHRSLPPAPPALELLRLLLRKTLTSAGCTLLRIYLHPPTSSHTHTYYLPPTVRMPMPTPIHRFLFPSLPCAMSDPRPESSEGSARREPSGPGLDPPSAVHIHCLNEPTALATSTARLAAVSVSSRNLAVTPS
ncbi:hypothetical protein DFH09DRAFT_1331187 [Mycena vulgaris]|nr:hypothetical protein DFH09DRAFT_1331187 [Mycena vulgaris]